MSIIRNQRQTYLRLAEMLRPHWRNDFALAERIQRMLSAEKRFGSRDRRLYRELLYTTVRYLPWVENDLGLNPEAAAATVAWLAADLPATRAYRAELTAGMPDCPATLADKARVLGRDQMTLVPDWLSAECPAALEPAEMDALHRRASLWLRLQTKTPENVTAELDAAGCTWRVSDLLPFTLEVLNDKDVTRFSSHAQGAFEIQDLGSQLLLHLTGITTGQRWFDACAGAGGKTLQLADMLGPAGQVTAHDIRAPALIELRRRAERAGLSGRIDITTEMPPEQFDGVLVDAPCSGSGTWRRSPHLKWLTTPDHLQKQSRRQSELLGRFAQLVKPGGRLIYSTCSLCRQENDRVVGDFLGHHPDFEPEPPARDLGYPAGKYGVPLLPARHNTDGFYVAGLRRR